MESWFQAAGAATKGGLLAAVAVLGLGTAAFAQGERWGARNPVRTCSGIAAATVPPADAIANLIRCERETITATDELWLLEDVSVQVGQARAHLGRGELMTMPDSDTSKPVHSLRGAWTWVVCRDPKAVAIGGGNPALNCSQARVDKAEGACWMTTFGNWRCNMTGPAAAAKPGFAPTAVASGAA